MLFDVTYLILDFSLASTTPDSLLQTAMLAACAVSSMILRTSDPLRYYLDILNVLRA